MVNVWTSCQMLLIHDITEDVTTMQNLLSSVFQSQDFFYLAELPTYRITHADIHRYKYITVPCHVHSWHRQPINAA